MKPISEHLSRVRETGATVFALSLEVRQFLEGPVGSSAEFARAISTIIHRYFNNRIVTLPGSDGFIFMVDGNSGAEGRVSHSDRVSGAVAEIRSKLMDLAPATRPPRFDIQVIDENRVPELTQDAFAALKMDQRYNHILNMLRQLKRPTLIFLRGLTKSGGEAPLYAQHEAPPATREASGTSHRDERGEISPSRLATDIQIMRAVCEHMSAMFAEGKVVPQYCPLSFNMVKDPRCWPIYEIEIRNVPSFFMPFIRWEIVGIRPGTPPETIRAAVDRLRPFTDNISVCQTGGEFIERALTDSSALGIAELSFHIPGGAPDRDWTKIVEFAGAYALRVSQRGEMIGLRNVPIGAQLPLNLLDGGIFLSPDASRRMNLVASEGLRP